MDVGNGKLPNQGCPAASQYKTIINRIMLRFRPIAPKPATESSTPGSAPGDSKSDLVNKRPRSRRKYVRVKKNNTTTNRKKAEEEEERRNDETVLTLQLLPESSGSSSCLRDSPKTGSLEKPFVKNFDNLQNINDLRLAAGWSDQRDRSKVVQTTGVVESWVVVDGMSNTWVDSAALGCTDMEKMKNLETDACPGLISDALNRVQWVNPAYRKMVGPLYHGGAAPELAVRLLVNENIGVLLPAAFACTVRVVYTWQKAKQSQTMPCDVWKMDFGGFAWRLDAMAALCLGR